jgi:hypothetical protein
MDASGHRFRTIPFVTGLAICVATACGGAVSTPLDRPAPVQPGDDETSAPVPEGSSSSSGDHKDATVPEEASMGKDMTMDAGDEPIDDAESTEAEAASDAGMCGVCFGSVCCMTPGARYYGRCYNPLFCGATCCL